MKRVTRQESLARYPSGCVMCGHDVAYLHPTVASTSAIEPDGRGRGREQVYVNGQDAALCPSCAKGYGTPHSPRCRGCQ